MNSKSRTRRSWQEKLADNKGLPKVEKIPPKLVPLWGEGTVAIPSPKEVDGMIRKVPRGKLATVNEIRKRIAKKHKATVGCPMTTGIFCWIAAKAAEEAAYEGKKKITPYWRILKTGGVLNEKYPGGILSHKRYLEKEGFKIIKKGSKYIVADFEKHLF